MENTNNTTKPETKVADTKSVKENNNSILSLLQIDEEEAVAEQAFLRHDITAKVDGYSLREFDDNGKPKKVQIQTKHIDEESGALVEFTFTLKGNIEENRVKGWKGKFIKVTDVTRYTTVERDMNGNETARTHRFGGELENASIVNVTDIDGYELNSYVEVELTSVANVMKKDKKGNNNPTGDVTFISIKEDAEGSIKTFECKFKHDIDGMKYDRKQFSAVIGKKIRINGIKDTRFRGETRYSTELMPELAQ